MHSNYIQLYSCDALKLHSVTTKSVCFSGSVMLLFMAKFTMLFYSGDYISCITLNMEAINQRLIVFFCVAISCCTCKLNRYSSKTKEIQQLKSSCLKLLVGSPASDILIS
uniref:Uncharacterized protein n=1 Tax=Oryza brachyantha TaxID=4533 RepID=J3M8B4_ORYBR